jgi:hypothetical protein
MPLNVAVWYIGVELAPCWSFVSTAAQMVEKRHLAARAARWASTDEEEDFGGREKMDVAREESEGDGGSVEEAVILAAGPGGEKKEMTRREG